MVRIDKKTLEDLEFPLVLAHISNNCLTDLGKGEVLSIVPFKEVDDISIELNRLNEFTASLQNDNRSCR